MMHEVWSDVCKEAWFQSSSLNREVTKRSYGCKCRSKSGARALCLGQTPLWQPRLNPASLIIHSH